MRTLSVFTLTAAVFLTVSCKQTYVEQEAAASRKAKLVKAIKLKETTEASSITASGVLASQKEITFSFKIGGIINHLRADQGARVRKGQILAELDPAEINAQVVQAQNAYDMAQRDLARADALYTDTAATLEQKQNAQTAVYVAKAALDVAEFNLRYSKITSPIDGKVLRKMAEEGELVGPGQPIYEVGSMGAKGTQVIRIGVADRSIVKIGLNDSAIVTFDAMPDGVFPASVSEIAEEANPFTGTFDVELTLKNYEPDLKNGFVGYVEVFPSISFPHYKVPMTALIEGDKKKATVFTSSDQRTVRRKTMSVVEIRNDHFTVLSSHFDESEWLVMEGGSYLNEGDSITIIK